MYECRATRHKFRNRYDPNVVYGVRFLAGAPYIFTCSLQLFSHVMQFIQLKEVVGSPDRFRRTLGVTKERRCDATFAYQQIMVDVHREVLDYTSRCVLHVFSFVS